MKPESRFTILRSVHTDAMGEVSEAIDNTTGRQVALRKLVPAVTQSNPRRQRLEEALVKLHKSGPARTPRATVLALQKDGAWFATEWSSASTLAFFKERLGSFAPEFAIQIACGILDALSEIHAQGLAHGGLSPERVLLTDGFNASGVALVDPFLNLLHDQSPIVASACGAYAGDPSYLAPEQVNGAEASVASDIYAVGLVLYELLTGKPAFAFGSTVETLNAQLAGTPVPPSKIKPDANISADLESALMLALSKDPSSRFGSAIAMRRALSSMRMLPFDEAKELAGQPLGRAAGQNIDPLVIAVPAVDASAAEAERLAAQQAEMMRLAAQQAEAARLAEVERLAAQQAEAMRLIEQERLAKEARAQEQLRQQQEAMARAAAEAQQQAQAAAASAAAAATAAQAADTVVTRAPAQAPAPLAEAPTPVVQVAPVPQAAYVTNDAKAAAWFDKGNDVEHIERLKVEAVSPNLYEVNRSFRRRSTGMMFTMAALILGAMVGIVVASGAI